MKKLRSRPQQREDRPASGRRRILIAGCGYVGQATGDLLHAAGWDVEGWVHSKQSTAKLLARPYPIFAVNITDPAQVAARPGTFDGLIQCVSSGGGDAETYRQLYLNGAHNLLNRFAGARMLFTSSSSVYAQRDGSRVTEESETKPSRETGRILLETEKLVLAHNGIVARLAGIYGPGRSALLMKFLAGSATIDLENDRYVNQVHRDDIAAALFLLLDQHSTAGEIYNVVDDQAILQSECYCWLAKKLNRPIPPIGRSASISKRGATNKRISNSKLRRLGWTPRYPTFAEAMEKSILPSFGALS